MRAINFTAFTDDPSQVEAIKTFMDSLKIKFELSKVAEMPYNMDFVEKIKQGDEDLRNGMGRKVTLVELDDLWK